MIILGIETSCDETAAAIVESKGKKVTILSNIVSSQVKLHAKWGGVVPNLAAREHLRNIMPVLEAALQEAGKNPKDIDLIGVTHGPGLIPALLVGTSSAKALAYLWQKPLLGIHHIEGHIYANFIRKNPNGIKFPILCLVVSGGHTQLVLMKNHLKYEIVGQTLDDAAGEAFDKVARILGLGYPGGPAIAAAAKSSKKSGFASLPRPMINSKDFDFSFSGLKTAVLYETKKHPRVLKSAEMIAGLASEFQQAVIDVLVAKTVSAAQRYEPRTIMLAGGVSANYELRKQLGQSIKKNLGNTAYIIPDLDYSIDNAAMIATAAFFRWSINKKLSAPRSAWRRLQPNANLTLN